MSSQFTPTDQLKRTVKAIELALSEVGAKLIQSNQQGNILNLLLTVKDDADIAKIASVISSMDVQYRMFRAAEISIVKLYRTLEGQSKPECFSTLDLNQSLIDMEEENPFFQESLPAQNLSDQDASIPLESIPKSPAVNPNLGLKQRASIGDVQAIKQLLDIALINRNATTIVRLEDKILNIKVAIEKNLGQETIISAIKRQLYLVKSDNFHTAEVIVSVRESKETWTETIDLNYTSKSNKEKVPSSKSGIQKITKLGVIASGIIASLTFFNAGLRFSNTGTNLSELRSISGDSLAEAYYQEMGYYGWAFANLTYRMDWGG